MTETRPILGVTMGDASGAGPEITVKALTRPEIRALCRPIVIGDAGVFRQAARIVGRDVPIRAINDIATASHDEAVIEVLEQHSVDLSQLRFAQVQAMAGRAAYLSVEKAVELALAGHIAAIVTAALHKEALNAAGYDFPGHTEILAHLCGVRSVTMLLVAGAFRVSHVSTHCSLRQAVERAQTPRIAQVIRITDEAVRRLGIPSPRIAVAGLNPHCGENGLFGDEDDTQVRPAVEVVQAEGVNVVGPIPPDTVFTRMKNGQYDAVVAMYHDQGHIAVKVLAFDEGVNVTLGLPIIRTSVDHGTVFGKAGKGTATDTSMVEALRLAAKMAAGLAHRSQ